MNWLFESPFTILVGAIAVGFFLGVAWVQTGKNAFLYSIGGVIAVAIGLLILERSIETDTEKVTNLIYQIAREVEANDADKVVSHIISSRPELAKRGEEEMKNHTFSGIKINMHSVTVHPEKQPPHAIARFTALISGSFERNSVQLEGRPIYFKLTFWKDHDGEWRVADYEYDINRPMPRASDED